MVEPSLLDGGRRGRTRMGVHGGGLAQSEERSGHAPEGIPRGARGGLIRPRMPEPPKGMRFPSRRVDGCRTDTGSSHGRNKQEIEREYVLASPSAGVRLG